MSKYKVVDNEIDFNQFKKLVADAGLPTEDLDYLQQVLIAFYEDQESIATAGLEIYGTDALLRSVAVVETRRRKGLGSHILAQLNPLFQEKGIKEVYLLTETAKDFFLKKGFEVIAREDVPKAMHVSAEFSSICPVSATVMRKSVNII